MKHLLLLLVLISVAWSAEEPLDLNQEFATKVGKGKIYDDFDAFWSSLKEKISDLPGKKLLVRGEFGADSIDWGTWDGTKWMRIGSGGHLNILVDRATIPGFNQENPPFRSSDSDKAKVVRYVAELHSNDMGSMGASLTKPHLLTVGEKQLIPAPAAK